MTLLVLPLMESVVEIGGEGLTAGDWLDEHGGQLFSFLLSFVVIASFWGAHNRLYEAVEYLDGWLLWLNIGWMLTIVWLPVPTAMVGSMDTDALQLLLYIGSMCLTSLLITLTTIYLRSRPRLLAEGSHPDDLVGGLAADIAATGLYVVALLVALTGVGYYALLLLWLIPVLQRPFARVLRGRASSAASAQ